jgi:2-dehydropantoate 2-reductase
MLQDALAHRPTEVAALNEGIARFGAETGVPTPLNEAIAALIRGMEKSWTSQPEQVAS